MNEAGFGVYVHWPICAKKCPYCDFNSHVRAHFDAGAWADAIARELSHVAALLDGKPTVTSLFFGGGTPSLMPAADAAKVLDMVAALWPLASDLEVTLEANPNSAEQTRFRDYRAAGINRLSLGVQALDDSALAALGRLHGADEARQALRMATETFPRVSLDLIYARPAQTLAAWQAELDEALSFGTEHLSLYQLTIEPGTSFATLARQGRLDLPDEERAAAFYERTQERCDVAGLPAYEISNHARLGAACRHNLAYWRYADYVGVGPGAHGRIRMGNLRYATQAERLPERWLQRVREQGTSLSHTALTDDAAAQEHLLMALRLSEGLDITAYETRWSRRLPAARIAALRELGLVDGERSYLRVTPKGRLVLNAIIAELA